jgi:aminoglycoside phosphotransferase (APT) family kinase protein
MTTKSSNGEAEASMGSEKPLGSQEMPGELIDVRTEERFDVATVADYLRDKLEGGDRPLTVQQFPGGHANLTYLLRFGGTESGAESIEYVLRRPPLGPVAKSSHDMHREYRALSRLWQKFPLAPRAFLYCDDEAIIGAEFVVMERRRGVVVRGAVPDVFGGGTDPVANRKLSEVVVGCLADFHAVDPASVGLQELGKPDGFLERQVSGWSGRYERAKTQDAGVAGEVANWLSSNLPTSPPASMVHNDWKLDNMAIAEDDPGRCVAVYDWDMCTIGDPLCDLGTLLGLWSDRGEAMAGSNPMPTQSEGFMTRDEAVAFYANRSGLDPKAVPYYVVFGTFKMAGVLQQIYFRYHNGQTTDERFAGLGKLAEGLFRLAASRRD